MKKPCSAVLGFSLISLFIVPVVFAQGGWGKGSSEPGSMHQPQQSGTMFNFSKFPGGKAGYWRGRDVERYLRGQGASLLWLSNGEPVVIIDSYIDILRNSKDIRSDENIPSSDIARYFTINSDGTPQDPHIAVTTDDGLLVYAKVTPEELSKARYSKDLDHFRLSKGLFGDRVLKLEVNEKIPPGMIDITLDGQRFAIDQRLDDTNLARTFLDGRINDELQIELQGGQKLVLPRIIVTEIGAARVTSLPVRLSYSNLIKAKWEGKEVSLHYIELNGEYQGHIDEKKRGGAITLSDYVTYAAGRRNFFDFDLSNNLDFQIKDASGKIVDTIKIDKNYILGYEGKAEVRLTDFNWNGWGSWAASKPSEQRGFFWDILTHPFDRPNNLYFHNCATGYGKYWDTRNGLDFAALFAHASSPLSTASSTQDLWYRSQKRMDTRPIGVLDAISAIITFGTLTMLIVAIKFVRKRISFRHRSGESSRSLAGEVGASRASTALEELSASTDSGENPHTTRYVSILEELGHQVLYSDNKWTIRDGESDVVAYAYFPDDLIRHAKNAASKKGIQFDDL